MRWLMSYKPMGWRNQRQLANGVSGSTEQQHIPTYGTVFGVDRLGPDEYNLICSKL